MLKKIVYASIYMNPVIITIGIVFAIVNSLFKCFQNTTLSNWCTAAVVCLYICGTTIMNNLIEYNTKEYPKKYIIWEAIYPIFFLGSILSLLWLNFVATNVSLISNIAAGCWLLLTVGIEILMGSRYDQE